MKVLGFGSWNLHADELDAMVTFYREVLGAELRLTHNVGDVKVARMKLGAAGLGLFDAAQKRAPGVPHHTFRIEGPGDPQDLVKEIQAKGVKVDGVRQHENGSGYSVYVIDPSGNRLELSCD